MQQAKRKKSYLGLIIIISTLTIVLLVLIGAIVGFFLSGRRAAEPVITGPLTGKRPLAMLAVDQVDPALALASLGGVVEADVIAEALDKARPETALAGLLFNPVLPNQESAGDFLLLAAAYAARNDQEKAVFCYRMAGTVATLSPDIADTVRADIFLEVSEGMIHGGQQEFARFYLNQAFILASKSPFLQAPQRRSIFQRLQKDYTALQEPKLARTSLDLSANPPAINPAARKEGSILPPPEAVALSAPVQEAEAARWEKAQELAARLVERGGSTPEATKEALKEALLREDQQKLPFYEAELGTTPQLSKKIDIAVAKIGWLSIKYRVARRGYGISLVPEWESEAEQIRAELTKTYETLFALYADLIIALPEASQIDQATEERLRREILAGELGRYPNYPEEQRRKQLLDATTQLATSLPDINIFVGSSTVNGQELYTLISPN